MGKSLKCWFVYLIECSDGSYYCGITVDVNRRIMQHNCGKGAKYTRGRGPVKLLLAKNVKSMSRALSIEYAIKKQKKKNKAAYLQKIKT